MVAGENVGTETLGRPVDKLLEDVAVLARHAVCLSLVGRLAPRSPYVEQIPEVSDGDLTAVSRLERDQGVDHPTVFRVQDKVRIGIFVAVHLGQKVAVRQEDEGASGLEAERFQQAPSDQLSATAPARRKG